MGSDGAEIIQIPDNIDEQYIDDWAEANPGVAPTLTNIIKDRRFNFITPEEAIKKKISPFCVKENLAELRELAKRADEGTDECENCGLAVWQIVNLGMCFTCVTGETDPSDDYELTLKKNE